MRAIPLVLEHLLRGVRFRLTRRLVLRDLEEAWPGIDTATCVVRPFAGRFGNVNLHELLVLCAVAKHMKATSLFEFGTFDGLTAWHLAANCGPEARIQTLDLPLDHPARFKKGHDRAVGKIQGIRVGAQFIDTPQETQITQILQDSMEFDPAPFERSVDFCFIDAAHGYEHVLRDTQNALSMVRPGGVILWHDYSRWWPGVQKVLDDLSTRFAVFRVSETSLGALHLPVEGLPTSGRPRAPE